MIGNSKLEIQDSRLLKLKSPNLGPFYLPMESRIPPEISNMFSLLDKMPAV
jgi:hypothetical protein